MLVKTVSIFSCFPLTPLIFCSPLMLLSSSQLKVCFRVECQKVMRANRPLRAITKYEICSILAKRGQSQWHLQTSWVGLLQPSFNHCTAKESSRSCHLLFKIPLGKAPRKKSGNHLGTDVGGAVLCVERQSASLHCYLRPVLPAELEPTPRQQGRRPSILRRCGRTKQK